MKYGKKILAQTGVRLHGEYAEVYCLDGGEYYDIHILNDNFKDEELNTLQLQAPKECYLTIPDEIQLTCWGIEFLLWHLFYGRNGKGHSFNCECVESFDL